MTSEVSVLGGVDCGPIMRQIIMAVGVGGEEVVHITMKQRETGDHILPSES
jgi:hypothetical protein